jgi:hypothetical protein
MGDTFRMSKKKKTNVLNDEKREYHHRFDETMPCHAASCTINTPVARHSIPFKNRVLGSHYLCSPNHQIRLSQTTTTKATI